MVVHFKSFEIEISLDSFRSMVKAGFGLMILIIGRVGGGVKIKGLFLLLYYGNPPEKKIWRNEKNKK